MGEKHDSFVLLLSLYRKKQGIASKENRPVCIGGRGKTL
jgi:hypothetical protein